VGKNALKFDYPTRTQQERRKLRRPGRRAAARSPAFARNSRRVLNGLPDFQTPESGTDATLKPSDSARIAPVRFLFGRDGCVTTSPHRCPNWVRFVKFRFGAWNPPT